MSAHQKRLACDKGTYDDMIRGLPENLLNNILERLPIRDAVRTSILSTKWRYLWSARTSLQFDQQFFETNFKNKKNPAYFYTMLINDILMLRTEPVLKFSLYIPNIAWDWSVHIDKWLLFLSRNGITELELSNLYVSPYKLPTCVFSCTNLKVLKVTNCLFKLPDKGSEFAKLQTLHFSSMSFSPSACGVFVLVAPKLTTLCFTGCRMIENCKITAPYLSALVADHCYDSKSISLDNFPYLIMVSFSFGNMVYEQGRDRSFNLSEFLKKLPIVRTLRLHGSWLKFSAATTFERRVPLLHLLTFLMLHGLKIDNLDQISCFLCLLKSSPCLQRLTISTFPTEGAAQESVSSHLEAPNYIYKMLNLQKVTIYSIKCSKPVMRLVKCILDRSPNLLSMEFDYIFDKYKEFKVSNELLRLPRASSKAEVIYSCKELASTAWAKHI